MYDVNGGDSSIYVETISKASSYKDVDVLQ